MQILVATSNPHKLDEIRAIFAQCEQDHAPLGVEFVSLADIGLNIEEPVEDGDTFEANAILKARYYANANANANAKANVDANTANSLCLADDSGLEVDALGGAPGVISAQYAGLEGPRDVVDPANNRKLINQLADTTPDQRTARFVCTMALCRPNVPDPLTVVRGTFEGQILSRDDAGPDAQGRGENGFGYDPLFYLPDVDCTSAELPPLQKNARSHRGDAARQLFDQLAAGVATR